jgi:hypothetical protein
MVLPPRASSEASDVGRLGNRSSLWSDAFANNGLHRSIQVDEDSRSAVAGYGNRLEIEGNPVSLPRRRVTPPPPAAFLVGPE